MKEIKPRKFERKEPLQVQSPMRQQGPLSPVSRLKGYEQRKQRKLRAVLLTKRLNLTSAMRPPLHAQQAPPPKAQGQQSAMVTRAMVVTRVIACLRLLQLLVPSISLQGRRRDGIDGCQACLQYQQPHLKGWTRTADPPLVRPARQTQMAGVQQRFLPPK